MHRIKQPSVIEGAKNGDRGRKESRNKNDKEGERKKGSGWSNNASAGKDGGSKKMGK